MSPLEFLCNLKMKQRYHDRGLLTQVISLHSLIWSCFFYICVFLMYYLSYFVQPTIVSKVVSFYVTSMLHIKDVFSVGQGQCPILT